MDPVILVLRLLVPLTIFRYPFLGGLASIWLDGIDWSVNLFGMANLHANYVLLDKILDLYYLSIEAYVIFRWRRIFAKKTGLWLFAVRALGIILFSITAKEYLLFFFPNIFENFFLFYYGVWTIIKREPNLSRGTLLWSVIILAIPKLIQEYVMHVQLVNDWRPVHIPFINFTYDNLYGQLAIGVILILVVSYLQFKNKARR